MEKIKCERSFQTHDGFLEVLAQAAQASPYQKARQQINAGSHPTLDMLHDYVLDELDPAQTNIIQQHIALCGVCAEETLRIRFVQEAIEADDETTEPVRFVDDLASEIGWELMKQAAAGMHEEHTFQLADGRIEVTCQWESPKEGQIGYVVITWNAEIDSDRELAIQFFRKETRELLYEEEIGTIRHSHATFTFDELGFDPEHEKWAIAIV